MKRIVRNAFLVTAEMTLIVLIFFPTAWSQTAWRVHPTPPPFQYTKFDGVFVPGPYGAAWANKVYFLGGRIGGFYESYDIWSFDPLTGAYADTGHHMIVSVSDYRGNLITDDGTGRGPAIYVIGGNDRDDMGCPVPYVQRYYPQPGEVELLAEDLWGVYLSNQQIAPGGTAVVNDIIYLFGGHQTVIAPFMSNQTWAFNPRAPEGHKFTNLGLPLSIARSYIQVAVGGTKIYAMGGHSQYTSSPTSDFVPTNVVEVLDAANPTGWTTLAPMPVATGEGRGFHFNNKLYVVGGTTDWPGQTAEVMEYDIASNTWNQAFPNLNQARRDHAGFFIPLCTPDPTDGLPGMWVFGGRINTDFPPFGLAEYYPLGGGAPVYRFWSPVYQHHFFTISEAEKNYVIATWPDYWTYEGIAWYAYPTQQPNTLPVFRFWSNVYRSHFFTISESEKNMIIATWPDYWTYEGIAWYAYTSQLTGTLPVYRFWSNVYRGHFFTISESEKNNIIATWPEYWTYEYIAYYALPTP